MLGSEFWFCYAARARPPKDREDWLDSLQAKVDPRLLGCLLQRLSEIRSRCQLDGEQDLRSKQMQLLAASIRRDAEGGSPDIMSLLMAEPPAPPHVLMRRRNRPPKALPPCPASLAAGNPRRKASWHMKRRTGPL